MVVRKMLNNKYKYRILISLVAFSFFFFSSFAFAINYGSGVYNSGLYSATIPSSIASPIAGTYTGTQSITLTTEGNNTIRYSTSTTPADCTSGTLYTTSIEVSSSQTIYTRACDSYGNSTPASFTYTIQSPSSGSSSGSSSGGGSSIQKIVTPIVVPIPETAISTNTNTIPLLITRTLSIKSKGEDVKALQTYLKNKGYSISVIDGIFGPQTKSAVIKFQTTNKLYPDGAVGPKTRELMVTTNLNTTTNTSDSSKYIFSKNIKLNSVNNDTTEVYQLQKFLNSHRYIISETGLYSPGNENQFFGLLVKKALIKFQIANKLNPDGIFGPKTREKMNSIK